MKKKILLILTLSILLVWNSFAQKTKLRVGDKIPEFELYNQYGQIINSLDDIGDKPLVIFFYPEDESYLCTKQFGIVRDHIEIFNKLNTTIIGINPESIAFHKRFVINNRLPFSLLFDRNSDVQKKFGVPNQKRSKKPKRYTFITDKNRIIQRIYHDDKNIQSHVNLALIVLNNLK